MRAAIICPHLAAYPRCSLSPPLHACYSLLVVLENGSRRRVVFHASAAYHHCMPPRRRLSASHHGFSSLLSRRGCAGASHHARRLSAVCRERRRHSHATHAARHKRYGSTRLSVCRTGAKRRAGKARRFTEQRCRIRRQQNSDTPLFSSHPFKNTICRREMRRPPAPRNGIHQAARRQRPSQSHAPLSSAETISYACPPLSAVTRLAPPTPPPPRWWMSRPPDAAHRPPPLPMFILSAVLPAVTPIIVAAPAPSPATGRCHFHYYAPCSTARAQRLFHPPPPARRSADMSPRVQRRF